MNEVIQFPKEKRKQIYKHDECAGCFEPYNDKQRYVEVTMPFHKYDKYILLCDKCEGVAERFGAF